MKTFVVLILIMFITSNLFAQEIIKAERTNDQEIHTLFKKEKRDGFYGAFSIGYSPIDNKNAMTVSSRGCWIMDHFFSLGIGGTAFVNNLEGLNLNFSDQSNNGTNLAGGYGGIILEPILLPLKPLHLSFPIMIGVGATGKFDNYSYFSTYLVNDFFWVVEPQAEVEINFTRWLRLSLYAGYRYTSELNITDISKDALRGYSTGVTIKMGLF